MTRYTDADREHACALALELDDVAEAARRLGLSRQLLHQWLAKRGLTVNTANRRANAEAVRASWEERRAAMVDRMGDVADKALNLVDERIDAGDVKAAKDGATTMAILVDKAQLLSGGATGRVYVPPQHAGQVIGDARTVGLSLVAGTD